MNDTFYMHATRIIFLLGVSFVVSACSDDEPSPVIDFTKNYQSTRIQSSSIRIFTLSGEIQDEPSRQVALDRYRIINQFSFDFLNEDRDLDSNETETLRFVEGEAVINSMEKFSYLIEQDFIRLTAKDTTIIPSDIRPASMDNLGIHKPQYQELIIAPGSQGVLYNLKTLEERYARTKSGQLRFPLIYYYQFSYGRLFIDPGNGEPVYGVHSTLAGSVNNELNEEIYYQLSLQDTLLVQQNWVVFE